LKACCPLRIFLSFHSKSNNCHAASNPRLLFINCYHFEYFEQLVKGFVKGFILNLNEQLDSLRAHLMECQQRHEYVIMLRLKHLRRLIEPLNWMLIWQTSSFI